MGNRKRATTDDRAALTSAVEDIHAALDRTSVDRLQHAARTPDHELWRVIGPPPRDAAGLTAWYGIADRYETWLDHRPQTDERIDRTLGEPSHRILGVRPGMARREWNELAFMLDHTEDIIDAARSQAPQLRGPTIDLETCHWMVDQAVATIAPTALVVERDSVGLGL